MGAINSCYYRLSSGKPQILMVGLDGAGKTTILYKLKMDKVVSTIPTFGFHVETVTSVKGLTFDMWDVGGQSEIRPFWHCYQHDIQGIVFVVDSTDRERFPECREELHTLLEREEARKVPLLVMANKQDLPGAAHVSEVAEEMGVVLLTDRKWHIEGTCAPTGEGLSCGMQTLTKFVRSVRKLRKNKTVRYRPEGHL